MSIPLFSVLGCGNLRLWNTTYSLLDNFYSAHEERQYCNPRLQSLSHRGFSKGHSTYPSLSNHHGIAPVQE